MEFIIAIVLNIILFAILNIWLLWLWALAISVVVVWGGFIIITGDTNIFD